MATQEFVIGLKNSNMEVYAISKSILSGSIEQPQGVASFRFLVDGVIDFPEYISVHWGDQTVYIGKVVQSILTLDANGLSMSVELIDKLN